jgi:diguanylate cyclase (GGDEF)-like protein
MASDALERENARLRAEVARLERRLAEVERLADRDPMLPLLNRRAFVRELTRALAVARRYGDQSALLYVDMDGLKRLNDAYGHAAGDAALAAVAATLVEQVRESDVVGRLGGDEFAVLLARAPLGEAQLKATALAQAVAEAPLVVDGRAIPLSVSVGVRPLDPQATAAELIAQADAAMYLTKGARRRA